MPKHRLHDKSKPPVIMGAVAGVPRAGMQTTAWGIDLLGWNAKWVVGYPGTNDLFVALERGEIDMTASGNFFQVGKLLQGGKIKVLNQSGTLSDGKMVARPEFPDAPVFTNELQGKLPCRRAGKGLQLLVQPGGSGQVAGAADGHAGADPEGLSRRLRQDDEGSGIHRARKEDERGFRAAEPARTWKPC